MNDYSLNIPWMIKKFKEATTIIINDRDTLKTPGIIGWQVEQKFFGNLLLLTGHRINWKTGDVEYVRKVKK